MTDQELPLEQPQENVVNNDNEVDQSPQKETIKLEELQTSQSKIKLTPLDIERLASAKKEVNNSIGGECNEKLQSVINNWIRIHVSQPPSKRSCHSSFIYQNTKLYIVGGVDISEQKLDDIYFTDLSVSEPEWKKVELSGEKLEKIAYHAGVLKDDVYYIIGGQNENLFRLNKIQRLDLKTNTLLPPITPDETVFPPIESHTALLYNNRIIIYGGIIDKGYNRHIYSFDLESNEITNLTKDIDEKIMPPLRAAHSTAIISDKMYIFGGCGPKREKYNDVWIFDLTTNTFTEIPINKPEHEDDEQNLKEVDLELYEEEEEEQPEEKQENKRPRVPQPLARCGQSMVEIGGVFYIFGGKIDDLMETNDLWAFYTESCKFRKVHDILIEIFSEEELATAMAKEKQKKRGFRWLTRTEVEKKTNPIIMGLRNKKKKSKKANKEKNEKNGKNEEIKSKYMDEIMKRPDMVKATKSLIYNCDTSDIKEIKNQFPTYENDKEPFNFIKGAVPEPRDGHSANIYDGNKILIFGGDRNKFPFSDLFIFDTGKLALEENDEENQGQNQKDATEAAGEALENKDNNMTVKMEN